MQNKSDKKLSLEEELKQIAEKFVNDPDFNELSEFYKEMKEKNLVKEPSFNLPIIKSMNIKLF